ncbi:MAG: hypothetical protein AAGE61_21995 [Pseudomonadota bacterium]
MTRKLVQPGIPGADAPRSVLYLCQMNAIRSPMAAAITRTLFPHIVYSRSAGIAKGMRDNFVDVVMEEVGIDVSTHHPHTFEELEEGQFELVVALTPQARDHALEVWGTPEHDLEYWATSDPSLEQGSRSRKLDAYRTVRDQLLEKIKDRLEWKPAKL